ncbi:MAG: hypothetical protein ACI83P_002880, partial [Janthinobacterium sp.]
MQDALARSKWHFDVCSAPMRHGALTTPHALAATAHTPSR